MPASRVPSANVERTRAGYDRAAGNYANLLRDELTHKPTDRAQLAVFAELVLADGDGPVLELGCGPGRMTAHLAGLGLAARGTDLSPAMVAVARREYPQLQFDVGDLTQLDERDLAGVVAWYSLIHTPPAEHPPVFTRIARALRPGGHLLAAFQVGNDHPQIVPEAYGHRIDIVAYRLSPDRMAARLTDAGLEVRTTTVRAPDPPERTPQAYLLARKPGSDAWTAANVPPRAPTGPVRPVDGPAFDSGVARAPLPAAELPLSWSPTGPVQRSGWPARRCP